MKMVASEGCTSTSASVVTRLNSAAKSSVEGSYTVSSVMGIAMSAKVSVGLKVRSLVRVE